MTGSLNIHPVPEWDDAMTCAPTALCAVTGAPPATVENAIRQCAEQRGERLDVISSVNLRDWGEALKLLGYHWDNIHGERDPPISINECVRANNEPGVVLILAFDDSVGEGHIFAAHGQRVVDCWTSGKIVDFTACPKDYDRFLVKYVLRIKH